MEDKQIIVYVLRTPDRQNTLNGFIFQTKTHRDEWMKQQFVIDDGRYTANPWVAQKKVSRCRCGHSCSSPLPLRLATEDGIILYENK